MNITQTPKTIPIKLTGDCFAVATIHNNGIMHYPGEAQVLIFETEAIAEQAKEDAKTWCNTPLHVIKLTYQVTYKAVK